MPRLSTHLHTLRNGGFHLPRGATPVNLVFRLEVSADTRYLEMIASLVEGFCHAAGLDEDNARGLQVAVDEICTNTVLHGYSGDITCKFMIEGWRDERRIAFVIKERGKPFDLGVIPEPDLDSPLETRPQGGLGLYLVRNLTDHFEYVCDTEGSKSFRLEKFLASAANGIA